MAGRGLSRREFLGHTSLAVSGAMCGLASLPSASAASTDLDKSAIAYRRLGRTNLKISHVVAAWDWNEALYPEAVRLGINYWHKIAGWPRLPEALKKLDREAWYCDVVIDTFDEQGATDQCEWALKSLGLDYVDSMKLHSIHKTPEDVKARTGYLRAFDKLKKQGKVKFLSAAQHGGNTPEICSAMIESGHFDHLQPVLSINPTPAQRQMLELAKKHDVGIIAKKVMGILGRMEKDAAVRQKIQASLGPDGKLGAAVIKTVLSLPGVTAVAALTRSFQQLSDNLTKGGIGLTRGEAAAVAELARTTSAVCNYCGECLAACPKGIPISDILRYAAYHSTYREPRRALASYRQLPAGRCANQCAGCGECEAACPRQVPVRSQLREAHRLLAC